MEWLDWVANQWWGSYRRRWRTKTLLLLETAHLVQAKIETERRCGRWWRQRLKVAITCTTCTWYKRCTSGTSSMAASWSNSRHESSQAILPLRGSHYERIRSHLHHPFKPSRGYLSPCSLSKYQYKYKTIYTFFSDLSKLFLQWDSFRRKNVFKNALKSGEASRWGLLIWLQWIQGGFPQWLDLWSFRLITDPAIEGVGCACHA